MGTWPIASPRLWRAGFTAATLLLGASALAAPVDAHEAGRAIYNFRCYFCHGYSGNARTLAATYLNPAPTDFTRAKPDRLVPALIVSTLENGRAGTAMQTFRGILSPLEMQQLATFVVSEFVEKKAINTIYHSPENGWPNHARYRSAYPFALGEIALSRPLESLTPDQAKGRQLYLASCVTCHDRGAPDQVQTGQDIFQKIR
jgi:cytochrome c oxidase cbb3-type subunit III